MAIVLCADDSPTIQKVVELTFAESGIQVVCVSDGEAAIRRFRELRPDVLLLDVAMPARSGYEVCEWVRREAGATQPSVLLLSSAFEVYDERRAAACGANGHLPKPFESQALLERVRGLLAGAGGSGARGAGSSPPEDPALDPFRGAEALSQAAPSLTAPHASGASPHPAPPAAPPGATPATTRAAAAARLAPADVDAIARRLVDLIGPEVIREIAWEIVPDLADAILREKLAQQAAPKGRQR